MIDNYDLLVIGGGSAGTTAAMAAVSFGKKVVLVEKGLIGGTCTNVGCVPSKSFLHAAGLIRNMRKAKSYGLNKNSEKIDFDVIKSHKENLIAAMRESGEKVLKRSGIETLKEKAVFKDSETVLVNNEEIRAKNILIATGSAPFVPPIEGVSNVPFLTSTDALNLEKLPESIIIVGGAYIGLEFATFFNSLGVKTTVIEATDRLAPNEDAEVSESLSSAMEKQGIRYSIKTKVLKVEGNESNISVTAEKDGKRLDFKSEKILIATGRIPNLKDLNLEDAGIKTGRKGIEINEYLETTAPNVYAAGDIIPSLQLEHVAVYEGWLSANNMFSEKKAVADYRVIPRVMFSYPEVASVGETEEQARNHANVETVTLRFASIPMAQISSEPDGLIKLVADASSGTLLGGHIVGANAGDLIHLAATAMQFNLPVRTLAESISAYPTFSQGFYYACETLADKLS